MGLAQSKSAITGVALACPGTSCTESTVEDLIVPDTTPPSDNGGSSPSSSSEDYWLWIVIGLGVLVLIFFVVCCYYRRKAKKTEEFNAMLYATPVANDGDMIQKDIEKDVSGKLGERHTQFEDHRAITRETEATPGIGDSEISADKSM